MNLFLQDFGGRGPTRRERRTKGSRVEGRVSRNTNIFLLMYIYRKTTKVQVKIVLKISLEHILSAIILILVYLPRYFFLILVCLLMPARKSLSVKLRLIQKPDRLICIANQLPCFYMIQIFLFQQSRFKKNKIGSWHTPPKHESSHSTIKIANRKAISSGLQKTTRDSIYFNKH